MSAYSSVLLILFDADKHIINLLIYNEKLRTKTPMNIIIFERILYL